MIGGGHRSQRNLDIILYEKELAVDIKLMRHIPSTGAMDILRGWPGQLNLASIANALWVQVIQSPVSQIRVMTAQK